MPNYNITIDSKFDPYSFEDYLKPLAILQEQHNQAADAYATALANSAGLYDALRANAEDAEAAKYVKDYENSLNALASDLATNGLNRTNRRGVYETKAKTGYIEKLKKAIDNRNAFIAQQNELLAKDPTRRVSDYAYNHGITRFLNPDFTYGSYSLNDIKNQVAETVKYLAKSEYVPQGNNPTSKRIGYLTNLMQTKTGASMDDIRRTMQAIENNETLDSNQEKIASALKDVVIEAVDTNMGSNYEWDKALRNEALQWGEQGLYSALGNIDSKIWNEQEPKLPSGSGSGLKDYLGHTWLWNDFLSANDDDFDLIGRDKKQMRIAQDLLNYWNDSDNNSKPQVGMHGAKKTVKNLINFAKDFYSDKDENIDEKQKRIISAIIQHSFSDLELSNFDIPKELFKDEKTYKQYRYDWDKSNTLVGNEKTERRKVLLNNAFKDIKLHFNVKSEDVKEFLNSYNDYVNKGSIRTEGAEFYATDSKTDEQIFKNISQLAGDPTEVGRFRGQNNLGNFVNDLKHPQKYIKVEKALYDDGKWRSDNRIGITTDGNGNVAAIIRNSDGAYQFDITNLFSKNFEGSYNDLQKYSAYQKNYNDVRKEAMESAIYQKFLNEENEKARAIENGRSFVSNMTLDEIETVRDLNTRLSNAYMLAQNYGKLAYNELFDNVAFLQDLVKRSSNQSAF